MDAAVASGRRSWLRWGLGLGTGTTLLSVAACAGSSVSGTGSGSGTGSSHGNGNASGNGASSKVATRPVRLGLALGGGAARGFAHVGILRALEDAGIRPAVVAGTSAGSLVGALYASGMAPDRLEAVALGLEQGALGDWSLSLRSLMRGQALQSIVNRHVSARPIERFPIPYAAVVTDLYNGEMRVLRSGDAGTAVRASSAVPGVFEPVRIDGREYVDGGLSSPIPVRAARSLGADVVIAVDISARPKFQSTDSMPAILLQTFAIMSGHLAEAELVEADLVLRPEVGDLAAAEFSGRQHAVQQGRMAVRRHLPEIRALTMRRVPVP
jgi:NTE family protein